MPIQQMMLGAGGRVLPSGYGSVGFNGSTHYMTIPDNDAWDLGDGAFTVECFAIFDQHGSWDILVHNLTDSGWSGGSWAFEFVGGQFDCYWYNTSDSLVHADSNSNTATGSWIHYAWVENGYGDHSFYKNGTRVATSGAGDIRGSSTNALSIGGQGVGAYFDGKISNLRITKQALYSGGYLTVPTSPLTLTSQGATASNVVLLCCNDPNDQTNYTVSPGPITNYGAHTEDNHPF
jgi:hypothetical protein